MSATLRFVGPLNWREDGRLWRSARGSWIARSRRPARKTSAQMALMNAVHEALLARWPIPSVL
jgi:hypothetical protein